MRQHPNPDPHSYEDEEDLEELGRSTRAAACRSVP
jgi:hypothetical protein